MTAAIDITTEQRKTLLTILRRFIPGVAVWAYGSRVKWTARPNSDLDLVAFTTPAQRRLVSELKEALEESKLPFLVDFHVWDDVPEKFRDNIEKEYVVLQEAKQPEVGLSMVSGWRERPFAELTDNFDSIRVPVKGADRRVGPYPYYGASGIVDYVDKFLFDGEYLLIAEDGENLRTRNTPVAFLARGKFWVNNHAHIVRGNNEADTRFLMYSLAVTDISGYLTGSTMPKLTQGNMNRIPVLAPPADEQRAIAHILGTLDDKIELNWRMNETQEAMARALFKSWFVDFAPVRAKAEGRNTNLPKYLADLFPASFEESELGEIPKGWTVKTLEEVTQYLNRGISPVYIETGGVLVLNQKCVRDGHVDPSKGRRHDPARRSIEGRSLRIGDILVNSTGVGTLGRVAQLLTVDEETIVDSHITVVRADERKLSSNFLGMNLLWREDEIEALGEGSTGQTELARSRLANLQVIVPEEEVVVSFDGIVSSLRQKLAINHGESRTLAALRDTLLPKLIFGELRLKDAEKILESK